MDTKIPLWIQQWGFIFPSYYLDYKHKTPSEENGNRNEIRLFGRGMKNSPRRNDLKQYLEQRTRREYTLYQSRWISFSGEAGRTHQIRFTALLVLSQIVIFFFFFFLFFFLFFFMTQTSISAPAAPDFGSTDETCRKWMDRAVKYDDAGWKGSLVVGGLGCWFMRFTTQREKWCSGCGGLL